MHLAVHLNVCVPKLVLLVDYEALILPFMMLQEISDLWSTNGARARHKSMVH